MGSPTTTARRREYRVGDRRLPLIGHGCITTSKNIMQEGLALIESRLQGDIIS